MIVKIKTFSGETLYIPEEDYLNEVMYSDLEEREFNLSKLRRVKLKGTRGTNNYLQGKINKWNGSLEKRLATTGKITQKDVERGALVGDLMAGNVKVPKKSTIGQMENFISRHSKL